MKKQFIAQLIIASFVGFLSFCSPQEPTPVQVKKPAITNQTSREPKTFVVNDSTQIWLNSFSTLEYWYDTLHLQKGEMYASVQNAKGLLIRTGDVNFSFDCKPGTRISLRNYPGDSLLMVRVDSGSAFLRKPFLRSLELNKTLCFQWKGDSMWQEIEPELEWISKTNWREGMISLSAPLRIVLNSVSRYYGVHIKGSDEFYKTWVHFNFSTQQKLPDVLESIGLTTHCAYQKIADTVRFNCP